MKDFEGMDINAALEALTPSSASGGGGGSGSWAVSGEWQDHLPLRTIHREFRDFLREGEWRQYDDANRAELLRELAKVETLISKIKSELSGTAAKGMAA